MTGILSKIPKMCLRFSLLAARGYARLLISVMDELMPIQFFS